MKSNYRIIGDFIRKVNVRNTELTVTNLMGINIDKFFMPSVANTVGTDMSKYRIVKKGQFACNRMHVGRDKRLPVALWKGEESIIVSPAYDVFEITNNEVLEPEYLMMWFSREEFDRNVWFYTDADVRGGLKWDDFCNIKLPIPDIIKQKEIVKEYKVLVNRIDLNNTLIQKFEETAQTIFKSWFVDFDFPDESGRPYKSNGGQMMFNNELDKEIPTGWQIVRLNNLLDIKYGKDYKHLENGNIPLYGSGGIMGYVNKHLYDKKSILIPRKGSLNNILFLNEPFWSVDTMFYSIIKNPSSGYYIYYFLKQMNFSSLDVGSAVPSMTTSFLNEMSIIKPTNEILETFDRYIDKLFRKIEFNKQQNYKLNTFKDVLLSKLATLEG